MFSTLREKIFLFLILFFFISCSDSKQEKIRPEETRSISGELEQVIAKYAKVKEFTADLKVYDAGYGSVSRDSGPPVPVIYIREGSMKFKKPFKLKLAYLETVEARNKKQRRWFITDGTYSWESPRSVMPAKDSSGSKPMVDKSEVTLYKWETGKAREVIKDLSKPMDRTDFGKKDPLRKIPAALLAPFKNLDWDRITFKKIETVNDEPCYLFQVKKRDRKVSYEGEDDQASHWIGKKDGIPRRIEIYLQEGRKILKKYELKNVKTNPGIADKEFTFINDGSYEVFDGVAYAKKTILRMEAANKAFPKTQFKVHFENPLKDISGLMGLTHGLLFSSSGAIRFKSNKKIILKNKSDYQIPKKKSKGSEKILSGLGQYFPKDSKYLNDENNLLILYKIKREHGNYEAKWFLHNKKYNVYFFLYSYAG